MSQQHHQQDKKKFNSFSAWIELSKKVQKDFRKRGITKKDLEDAIAWARRNGRRK